MKQAHIKYISGLILFGLNGIVSSKILLSSYDIVFFRTLLGSIFLLALCFITKTKFNLFQFPKQMLFIVLSGISMGLSWIFCGNLSFPAGITQWGWVLFLGIVNTGVGCYLYFSDIAKLPVTVVSILGYLEPLSAVIFVIILLHESLSLSELIGAILILSGAIFSELFNKSE